MSEPTESQAIADTARAIAILPTIARNIWFFPAIDDGRHEDGQPFAAIIAGVNDDGSINLMVAARDGSPYGVSNVRLVQEGEPVDPETAHAVWMPYQRGQAPASSAVEGRLQQIEKLLETDGSIHKLFTGVAKDVGERLAAFEQRVVAVEQRPQPAPAPALNAPPAPAPEGGQEASQQPQAQA